MCDVDKVSIRQVCNVDNVVGCYRDAPSHLTSNHVVILTTCHRDALVRWHGDKATLYHTSRVIDVIGLHRVTVLRSEGEARAERQGVRVENSNSTNVPSIKIKKLFLDLALKQKEDKQEVNRPRGQGRGQKKPRHTDTVSI